MDEAAFRRYLSEIGEGIARRRVRSLAPELQVLHRRILRQLAKGRRPNHRTLETWAEQLHLRGAAALDELVAQDLIFVANGDLAGAYPFSVTPTRHAVAIVAGPVVYACCALDALGIGPMLSRETVVMSRDPRTGREINVRCGPAAEAIPETTVVTIPPRGRKPQDQRSCDVSCPHINFHVSAADARAEAEARGTDVEILTLPQAYELGALLFGNLSDGSI